MNFERIDLYEEYRDLFGEGPPEMAFGTGMDKEEWFALVRKAINEKTIISPETIKQLTGKAIMPEGAYTDEAFEEMQRTVEQGQGDGR